MIWFHHVRRRNQIGHLIFQKKKKKNYSFADEDVLDQRPPAPTEPEKLKLANAYKLARRCVKKEPDGRPTMKDVFKNISQEYNSSRTLSDNASSSRTLLDN